MTSIPSRQMIWRHIWKKRNCLGNTKQHPNCSRTAVNSLRHKAFLGISCIDCLF
ncbi:transmembrane protein 87A [Phyllostomus discolor]|uniref:Transmembrane protein 87A n=1 Tax=Phyllostomus discolor TaxID=89673 RepID=A0A834BMR9_9CHIR|nr:transmembrane protein 87A [Phyllostomus discolor]